MTMVLAALWISCRSSKQLQLHPEYNDSVSSVETHSGRSNSSLGQRLENPDSLKLCTVCENGGS